MRQILTNSPDVALVLPFDGHRHRVALLRRIVPEPEPRESLEKLAGPRRPDALLRLHVDRDGVTGEDGHADGRGRDRQIRRPEDLARLVDELQLFAGIAVGAELIDVWNQVEGNPVGEEPGHDRLPPGPRQGLLAQVLDAPDTRPRNRLIAGRDDTTHSTGVV